MDELEFECVLEVFLTHTGVEIEGDIHEKMEVVLANGELGVEFAQYLFDILVFLQRELRAGKRKPDWFANFIDHRFRPLINIDD